MNCIKFKRRIIPKIYAFVSKCRVSTSRPTIIINVPRGKPESKFLKYLETTDNNDSSRDSIANQEKLKEEYERKLLTGTLDIASIKLLAKYADAPKLNNYYERICASLCSVIDKLLPSEILEGLALMLKLDRSRITSTKFYEISINYLKQALQRDQLDLQQTLKLVYFCGLRKKQGARDVILVTKCLPPLINLSRIEQCLVVETMYKCSIKLKKRERQFFEEMFEKNAETLISERFAVIPLCKAIRFAGLSANFSMENLTRALINSEDAFNIAYGAHLTLLYAENHLKEIRVLDPWFHDFWNILKQYGSIVKIEDVEKFLLAGAALNYPINDHHALIINDYFQIRLKELKLKNQRFMNILLSLWMSGYQAKEMIAECFKEKILENLVNNEATWKTRARIQLFIACISIEAPAIEIPEELKRPQNIGLKIDRNMRIILKTIKLLANDLGISQIEVNCPIPGIDIAGVSFTYKNLGRKFHIDLLDERTTLRDSTEFNGLMNLKLRLLPQIGYQSILLTPEKIDEGNLHLILQDSLNEKYSNKYNCKLKNGK